MCRLRVKFGSKPTNFLFFIYNIFFIENCDKNTFANSYKTKNKLFARNLKGEIRYLFDPCVNVMGRRPYWPSWRWVIVPSDLEQSFGAICAHYHYRVIHRAIIYMHAWFKSTRKRQLTLIKITWWAYLQKKSGGTITHLHTWRQDGCHNRLPFKFPWLFDVILLGSEPDLFCKGEGI